MPQECVTRKYAIGEIMIFVYMTAPTMQEAKSIAAHMVEKRLAAGVNIFPEVHSIYHWQGKVENASECVCIFKTDKANFNALRHAIIEKHSYITPCIVALPVEDADENFTKWVKKESGV